MKKNICILIKNLIQLSSLLHVNFINFTIIIVLCLDLFYHSFGYYATYYDQKHVVL